MFRSLSPFLLEYLYDAVPWRFYPLFFPHSPITTSFPTLAENFQLTNLPEMPTQLSRASGGGYDLIAQIERMRQHIVN